MEAAPTGALEFHLIETVMIGFDERKKKVSQSNEEEGLSVNIRDGHA